MTPPSYSPRYSGFTLVEVVLSLGVIAFAFVGIVGMLPVGMEVSRRAVDVTIVSQITQQLTTQAQQTNFSQLVDWEADSRSNPYLFDDQGNRIANSADAIYAAAVSVSTSTHLPESVTTHRLATVTVHILGKTSNRSDSDPDITRNRDARRVVILIPDNGR